MTKTLKEGLREKISDSYHRHLKQLPVLTNTQSAVIATIEVKERDSNIVELDSRNYGAPPKNKGITIYNDPRRVSRASLYEPQAWCERGNWYYNFPGAIRLARLLGRKLPNIDQLLATINANPDNFRQSAGYRSAEDYVVFRNGRSSHIWSSSEDVGNRAKSGVLDDDAQFASENSEYYDSGLSVRFIANK